ncbi:1-(5-phosphoribosyl)-5-[(5-phosphoribosylamino)methylideneamino]imidazole-4-carboxamide isomerase [Candidatus Haliotispira prima]|uniref:1-(5-phosphoribosyl)-5-[(5-phosphoribosylamino)methylideneamino] imidazole-4-carboxamide isomerase n=1 Tax=Candidatus Haliotispira prima TaxID=3034016 RepID=A0ABY8MIK8_9SPIO|nr:1-(5-phosphoribosyl)-5-[(5-phosphoribosylamino)methylideneamino]imidazole-4-carboxamide isomerase [Candidatus Haliotispira prima]
MLTLYPAIDLIDGRCVRLTQGDFARQSSYQNTPEELAANYRRAGSEWLHVIDLDSAGSGGLKPQLETIQSIVKIGGLKVQCGGGIRSRERLQQIFAAGVERAIVGSLCIKQPELVREWFDEFGPERIVLALDIHHRDGTPYMAIHGWQELSDKTLWQLLEEFPDTGQLLCTDIAKDGTLQGPNFSLYQNIQQRFPLLHIQASGGIATLSDLECLAQNRISGAVLGKSLLEGRFTLQEALHTVRQKTEDLPKEK